MKYSEQLRVLRDVQTFQIDEHDEDTAAVRESDFFDCLYVPRAKEEEAAVTEAVTRSRHLAILVAPTGGGKTTVLRKIIRDLRPDRSSSHFVDFKMEVAKLYARGTKRPSKLAKPKQHHPVETGQSWPHRIQTVIRQSLAGEFLADEMYARRYVFQAVRSFYGTRYTVLKWKYLNSLEAHAMSDDEVWQHFQTDFGAIAKEMEFLDAHVTVSEMVRALMKAYDKREFCLVLDNIDRLDVNLQAYVLGVAVDIHRGSRGHFRTVVAVRKKNILRYQEEGMGGDVIHIASLRPGPKVEADLVRLDDPTSGPREPTDERLVSAMLSKRHSFAEQRNPDQDEATQTFWHMFTVLSQRVNTKFIEDQLLNLSNRSFSQLLEMHIEFISYLFELIECGTIAVGSEGVRLEEPELMSYLYRWLTVAANHSNDLLSDTVEKYRRFDERRPLESLDCDLEHVSLAWLSINASRRTRLRDVYVAFASIGVKQETIAKSLFGLYDRMPERRYVELGSAEVRLQLRSVLADDGLRVAVTPLGRAFATSMLTKLEFLYQALVNQGHEEDTAELYRPVSETFEQKMTVVLPHLALMATVHGHALKAIRESCRGAHTDWEEYYRSNFCLDGKLILERMMYSHLRHIARVRGVAETEIYRKKYLRILEDYLVAVGSKNRAESVLSMAALEWN